MLEHVNSEDRRPERVVVMGAGGFVGGALTRRLEAAGVDTLALSRSDVDLLAAGGGNKLAGLLRAGDTLVAVSAIAPVKNMSMLRDNLTMIENFAQAIAKRPVFHVVNISSDAVYADGPRPLSENSCVSPGALHGVMHLTRELMLKEAAGETPFATLRPTLIYGASDPHNGYGPNRFRRLAAKGEDIVLFGEGEERRDHVAVDDVAEVIYRTILRRSRGALNVVTGQVYSFRELAEKVVALSGKGSVIRGTPRSGPMPHDGYRPFDISACKEAFPDFSYASIDDGLARAHKEMMENA